MNRHQWQVTQTLAVSLLLKSDWSKLTLWLCLNSGGTRIEPHLVGTLLKYFDYGIYSCVP